MTQPQEPELINLQVSDFPSSLRRALKVAAAVEGITMREAWIEAVQNWVTAHTAPLDRTRPLHSCVIPWVYM